MPQTRQVHPSCSGGFNPLLSEIPTSRGSRRQISYGSCPPWQRWTWHLTVSTTAWPSGFRTPNTPGTPEIKQMGALQHHRRHFCRINAGRRWQQTSSLFKPWKIWKHDRIPGESGDLCPRSRPVWWMCAWALCSSTARGSDCWAADGWRSGSCLELTDGWLMQIISKFLDGG